MWYEILPSLAIVCVGMGLPHFGSMLMNKLCIDNMYRRCMDTKNQRMQYLRDRRLTDNPYKLSGLEAIPDE